MTVTEWRHVKVITHVHNNSSSSQLPNNVSCGVDESGEYIEVIKNPLTVTQPPTEEREGEIQWERFYFDRCSNSSDLNFQYAKYSEEYLNLALEGYNTALCTMGIGFLKLKPSSSYDRTSLLTAVFDGLVQKVQDSVRLISDMIVSYAFMGITDNQCVNLLTDWDVPNQKIIDNGVEPYYEKVSSLEQLRQHSELIKQGSSKPYALLIKFESKRREKNTIGTLCVVDFGLPQFIPDPYTNPLPVQLPNSTQVLRKCIGMLANTTLGIIPCRNSVITSIIADFLNGNGMLVFFMNFEGWSDPKDYNHRTNNIVAGLEFARTISRIKCRITKNYVDSRLVLCRSELSQKEDELSVMKDRFSRLQQDLMSLQRDFDQLSSKHESSCDEVMRIMVEKCTANCEAIKFKDDAQSTTEKFRMSEYGREILNTENKVLSLNLELAKYECESLKVELQQSKEESFELLEHIKEVEGTYKIAEEKFHLLKQQKEHLLKKQVQSVEETEKIMENIDVSKVELESTKAQLQEQLSENSNMRQEIDQLKSEICKLEADQEAMTDIVNKKDTSEKEKSKLQRELKRATDERNSLRKVIEEEKSKHDEEKTQLKDEIDELKSELKEEKKKEKSHKNEINALKKAIEEEKKKTKEMKETVTNESHLQEENDKLSHRLDEMIKMNESLKAERDKVAETGIQLQGQLNYVKDDNEKLRKEINDLNIKLALVQASRHEPVYNNSQGSSSEVNGNDGSDESPTSSGDASKDSNKRRVTFVENEGSNKSKRARIEGNEPSKRSSRRRINGDVSRITNSTSMPPVVFPLPANPKLDTKNYEKLKSKFNIPKKD
ncbi:4752_t:CDS:2 [Acaulospora morrowiae]|uniref:4752_t:CDS:1 n=1 Tax=Acaulospora morrowiae TaxID=94023 RepID=A0A9N9B6Z5_9GLOM|nr:4752_t:CDS:2 [Acaulospora morrowiae]